MSTDTNIFSKLNDAMGEIDYGWVDKNGARHEKLSGFSDLYALQLPNELRKSKLGVCWDQVELERDILTQNNVATDAYFIVYYDDNKCPTHTFILFENKGKTVWYEHAWEKHRGWYEFASTNEALREVREKFIAMELAGVDLDWNKLCIYKYPAPTKKLGCLEFYKHCEAGENIVP